MEHALYFNNYDLTLNFDLMKDYRIYKIKGNYPNIIQKINQKNSVH